MQLNYINEVKDNPTPKLDFINIFAIFIRKHENEISNCFQTFFVLEYFVFLIIFQSYFGFDSID